MGPFYLGLRGTYYDDVAKTLRLPDVDLRVIPVDLSLGLQWAPVDDVELYGGAGATYYFLHTSDGSIDDEVDYTDCPRVHHDAAVQTTHDRFVMLRIFVRRRPG